ncbi:methyl-accepting chemotaxis protein [Paenibacillus albidus]|nr:methyl-accepting chemotaxis protein [Paenibacillus albidus]
MLKKTVDQGLSQQESGNVENYMAFEDKLILHRNKLMGYMILLISLFAVPMLAIYENVTNGIIIIITAIVINGGFFYLLKSKIAFRQIPYMIVVLSSLLMIYLNTMDPSLISLVSFAVLLTLYPTYKPLLVYSIISILQLNYFILYPAASESPSFMWTDNVKLIMPLIVLFVLSYLSRQLIKNVFERTLESKQAQQNMEFMLEQMKSSIQEMGAFNRKLQKSVKVTGEITGELTIGFTEMTRGVESQAVSVSDISSALSEVNTAIQTVADNSSMMRELSNTTAESAGRGNEKITELSHSITDIRAMMEGMALAMEELHEQNHSIGTIVETIQSIAAETNLLALNAAIEAARAGEQGRGFAVVSAQVRKLAEHSHQSAEEIAGRLGSLRTKVEHLSSQMEQGKVMILTSESTVKHSEQVFRELSEIAVQVVKQAEEVEEKSIHVRNSSDVIVTEVDSISAVTEESSAASEQILASVEEQKMIVDEVVEGFERLEELIESLESLSRQAS